MKSWVRFLSVSLVLVAIFSEGEMCTEQSTAYRLIRKLEIYKCGWWSWWNCRRAVYTKEPYVITQCCQGYTEVDGVCTADTSNPLPNTEGCGEIDPGVLTKLIVNGYEATYKTVPWQASLTSYGDHFCGASYIGGRFILTAAHCVENWSSSEYAYKLRVVLGQHRIGIQDSNQANYVIESVREHGLYDTIDVLNDIALIKVTTDVVTSEYVKPVCLPAAADPVMPVGTATTISGWGATEAGPRSANKPTATTLMRSTLYVDSDSRCAAIYGVYDGASQICATDGQNDVVTAGCFGDSGGPMTVTRDGVTTLVGITSYGAEVGCAMGVPTVYSEVVNFVTWIHGNMATM